MKGRKIREIETKYREDKGRMVKNPRKKKKKRKKIPNCNET